jgi:hypothetical protein
LRSEDTAGKVPLLSTSYGSNLNWNLQKSMFEEEQQTMKVNKQKQNTNKFKKSHHHPNYTAVHQRKVDMKKEISKIRKLTEMCYFI